LVGEIPRIAFSRFPQNGGIMRLWSLSPAYLDAKGLLAAWREGLLAQKVLEGRTKGYRRHPQLDRFRASPDPLAAIGYYLSSIHAEASGRGYRFDASKIVAPSSGGGRPRPIPVTEGQLDYEFRLLKSKLALRDKTKYEDMAALAHPVPGPAFRLVPGGVEAWEKVKDLDGL
jgi:hypothetical protein